MRKQLKSDRRLMLLSLAALLVVACVVPLFRTNAADPASGTLNPTLNASQTWRGTASGGASQDETTCVEGFNCDTYALTLSGSPAAWSGKNVSIKITAALPSTDYDLVVHKGACGAPSPGACTGAAVGNSGNSPGQPEEVILSPSDTGTGIYSVRVIYFAATTADQYQGSATVVAGEATEPQPTPTPGGTLPPSCTVPGTTVATDPTGDASPTSLNPNQLDITKVSIAEPAGAAGEEKLTFSVDVADLSSTPPNSVWSVRFVPPGTAPPTTYYYVSAESDALGNVTYHYGRIEGSSVATSETGEGSVDRPNKRLIITAPRSGIGNPQPGQNLTDVHGVTQQQVGILLITADTTRDAGNPKIYTLRGNAQCAAGGPAPTPTPFVEPTPIAGAPRYANYQSPQGLGDSAGEPTLGANWASKNVMYIAGLEVLRISFNDCFSPSKATWERTNQTITNANTLDPILFTDNDAGNGANRTNRTFVSQLAAADGSSLFEFTDDDGQTYTPGAKGSGIGSGVDHQTVGGGPYAKTADGSIRGGVVKPPGSYPNAVYYASQNIGYANLARSDNGGLNFGPAVPMYDLTVCGGLHGHIKVAPDGTIYVPNKGCGGQQAVVVSEDNGITFQVRKVPGSKSGDSDPSLGIGANGTVYFGYSNGDGRPRIAVSRDKGLTWTDDQSVGVTFGVKSSVFPAVVAGDDDRASFFFLGSTTPGGRDDDAAGETDSTKAYNGTWYGYIATTYDGGKTWVTVNATPKDPVQRGVVCTNGTTCPSGTRNLLDFNDITMDEKGRALAAYADGCISADCIQGKDKNNDGVLNRFDNDATDKAVLIRQSGGKTLRAAFDASGLSVPPAPLVTAFYDPKKQSVTLHWERPESEAPITGYKVYRTRGNQETLIATLGPNALSYEDTTGKADDRYRVAAVNPVGESPASCGTVLPTVLQSSCDLPGRLVVVDSSDAAPNTPLSPEVDIKSIYIGEPRRTDNVDRLVFTMNVGPSSTGQPPTSSQWYIIWNRQVAEPEFDRFYVAMKSDGAGVVRYEYGKFGIPLATTDPNPNANIPVKLGDADGGTYNPTTGVITITLSRSKAENVESGQTLNAINARTFFNQPDAGPKSQRNASDITGDGSYQVVGSSTCPAAEGEPTPTPTPIATPTPTPIATPTPTPIATPTPTPIATPTPTPIATPTPTPIATPTPSPIPPTPSPTPVATPTPSPTPVGTPSPTPTPATTSTFQFNSVTYTAMEDCAATTVTVTRLGLTNTRATVDYTSNDGTARQKGDYTYATGRLIFEPGETQKTFTLLINEDAYVEGTETATLVLQNPTGGTTLGTPAQATLQILDDNAEPSSNPIDDARNFVCQQYHDFLNRQSDPEGENFWTNQITSCGNNASCIAERRVNVSAAFFLSIEFRDTGYFAIRVHKASFGSEKSNPRYQVFLRDQREINEGVVFGQPGAEALLEANRQRYLLEFVTRAEFTAKYPNGMAAATYVDMLFANAGATPTPSERQAAISAYGTGDTGGRVGALRSVAESNSVFNAQYNPAFVLMQYYGYLRRNADDAPDNNFSGYDFWLAKLNSFSQPGENVRNESVALARVRRAEMVRAFIDSIEYRERFRGHPSGNQQGPTGTADAARNWRSDIANTFRYVLSPLFGSNDRAG